MNEAMQSGNTELTPREQIENISARLHYLRQEVTKYEAMLDEVLSQLTRRASSRASKAIVPTETRLSESTRSSLSKKMKKLARKFAKQRIEEAKPRVLSALKKFSEPVVISSVTANVPHTTPTVRDALEALAKEGSVLKLQGLDGRKRLTTLWQKA